MSAPLGVRICPVVDCDRRIHESAAGIVYARCLGHTLAVLHYAFTAPASGPDRGVPPVLRSGSVAASVNERRPAA